MVGLVRAVIEQNNQVPTALWVWLPVLLLVLPIAIDAGPAGPAEAAQEEFSHLPQPKIIAAHTAITSPYLAIHTSTGVKQRLLHPFANHSSGPALPEFGKIRDVSTKKTEFFSFLLPMVEQENEQLLSIRTRLGFIHDHIRFQRPIDAEDQQWLTMVVKKFRLKINDPKDPDFWSALLRRVDVLPVDLVLVQAANESAWGTSRFAREGNNLFGQWCFRPGCGMVPSGRPAGATYEVVAFDTISESISSYMHNLNTGRVYEDLRVIREQCRAENRPPEAAELATGLTSYSERGMAYVTEIRAMLRHNAPVIAQLGPQ